MILFWGLLIIGTVAIARWVLEGRSTDTEPRERTGLDILKERYAHREIHREEFEQERQICSLNSCK
jgi:putative membrane protein